MHEKRSNLCVAANFSSIQETVEFIDQVGKYICILKTQCERFKGDPEENLRILYNKKREHKFLLFEDRKFYDGMETIKSIYAEKYVKYVDLVTVVPICGDGVFKAIESAVSEVDLPEDEHRGCLAVCEVSFDGFIPVDPTKLLEVAERNSKICVGIIAQKLRIPNGRQMIKATPGVHISETKDGQNQKWKHPVEVISDGADIVIVGRGIVGAPRDDIGRITQLYKEVAYKAYCDTMNT